MENQLDELRRRAEEIVGSAYTCGVHDGRKIDYETARERGQNEAWEAARKIVYLPSVGGYSASELLDIFGRTDISSAQLLKHNTAAEVITKIKKYENCIKVGNEVTDNDGWKGVVTWISPDGGYLVVTLQDGTALRWEKEHFKKTGRHFPQIEEVLKQMQESEE